MGLAGVLRLLAWRHSQPPTFVDKAVVGSLVLTGAALIGFSAWIHLHLWARGYRHIPTVGVLFLLQGVLAIAFAVLLILVRRVILMTLGATFMVMTAGGLLLSTWVRLFGYKENLAVPYAGMSLVVEVLAAVVLIAAGVTLTSRPADPRT